MRIDRFEISHVKNITLAQCDHVPNLLLIAGENGSGKSALLYALMAAKEICVPYTGTWNINNVLKIIQSGADSASIYMRFRWSNEERSTAHSRWKRATSDQDDLRLELVRQGGHHNAHVSGNAATLLLQSPLRGPNGVGFIDYIESHRAPNPVLVNSWDADYITDTGLKTSITESGTAKFTRTKQLLVALAIREGKQLLDIHKGVSPPADTSLERVRRGFAEAFPGMAFRNVLMEEKPFRFIVDTPSGPIDVDDLSSGEREFLDFLVRVCAADYPGSIYLIDELEAHLHPAIHRRVLRALLAASPSCQIIATTHSPAIMADAPPESLYRLEKTPSRPGGNQLIRVSSSEEVRDALVRISGGSPLVATSRLVVLLEGEDTSFDIDAMEQWFPQRVHDLAFASAGNSSQCSRLARDIHTINMSAGVDTKYYAIVDGDLKSDSLSLGDGTTVRLPYYHIESALLDEVALLAAAKRLKSSQCPWDTTEQVTQALLSKASSEAHIKKLAGTLLSNKGSAVSTDSEAEFAKCVIEAKEMVATAAIAGTWKTICAGRQLLRLLASDLGVPYSALRNTVLRELTSPPKWLEDVIVQIKSAAQSPRIVTKRGLPIAGNAR